VDALGAGGGTSTLDGAAPPALMTTSAFFSRPPDVT
jgi:hypothetical protein